MASLPKPNYKDKIMIILSNQIGSKKIRMLKISVV